MKNNDLLRQIPAIETLLVALQQDPRVFALHRDVQVQLLRKVTNEVRQTLMDFNNNDLAEERAERLFQRIFELTMQKCEKLLQPSLRKVINATGVVLHTNLGRAPLSARAQSSVLAVMEGYSTLEYNVEEGGRGERYNHIEQRLEGLTGAEASIVVNNNAAAVLLTLAGIARGREVIVSRGELVEIGGSFRIPDVIRQSGAVLVEVGTTNKTHLLDYETAITENTAAILKVHTSNFEIVGFTSQPTFEELCRLSREKGLISINDVGSGTLLPFSLAGHREPTVRECIAAGFDLVTFSGDKLLGAGQAGIIVGKKSYINQLKSEPLLRAFRIDKLSLAALEGTLIDYATGRAEELIPGWLMLNLKEIELEKKAEEILNQIASIRSCGWKVKVIPTISLSGGGSLPSVELRGYGLEVVPKNMSAAQLERALRKMPIPIICLLRDQAVVLDVRCLRNEDSQILCNELLGIVGRSAK